MNLAHHFRSSRRRFRTASTNQQVFWCAIESFGNCVVGGSSLCSEQNSGSRESLPHALADKYPDVERNAGWQFVFPDASRYIDRQTAMHPQALAPLELRDVRSFFVSTALELDKDVSLSWSLTPDEIRQIADSAARDDIRIRIRQINQWLHKK